MRGSCVHQRRKVRTGTPICSQISACVRPCIASRCNRSSPLGLFHLLIWDSRAKVSPPYEKTAHTGSTLEEPYGRRMTRVCTVLAMKYAGAGKE